MTITLEINNPFYLAGLQDLAQTKGEGVPEVCMEIIARAVSEFADSVADYKRELANQLTEARRA